MAQNISSVPRKYCKNTKNAEKKVIIISLKMKDDLKFDDYMCSSSWSQTENSEGVTLEPEDIELRSWQNSFNVKRNIFGGSFSSSNSLRKSLRTHRKIKESTKLSLWIEMENVLTMFPNLTLLTATEILLENNREEWVAQKRSALCNCSLLKLAGRTQLMGKETLRLPVGRQPFWGEDYQYLKRERDQVDICNWKYWISIINWNGHDKNEKSRIYRKRVWGFF